ncbi:MAG: energy transducer TonB [Ignavibacteriaceae bacterium]
MRLLFLFITLTISISYAQIDSSKRFLKDEPIHGAWIYSMPEPIGGINAIQQEIAYPTEALINQIEGKVYIVATIDSLGDVVETKIIKSIGYGCDEEAVHIVKVTKFTPAITTQGRRVKCQISIPIIFKLPKRE